VQPSLNDCCYGNKTILRLCIVVALHAINSAVPLKTGPQPFPK